MAASLYQEIGNGACPGGCLKIVLFEIGDKSVSLPVEVKNETVWYQLFCGDSRFTLTYIITSNIIKIG